MRWLRKDQDLVSEIYSLLTFNMSQPAFPRFRQFMIAQNPVLPDNIRLSPEGIDRLGFKKIQVTINPSLRERN